MRNSVRFVMFVLALLALLGLVACSKSPTGPTPIQTCQDPKASNLGGPLPCVYPPPVQSFAKLDKTIPTAGATLVSANSYVTATVSYGVSQPDMDEAKAGGYEIEVTAGLSVDGIKVVPVTFTRPALSANGQYGLLIGISKQFTPDINQTNYIIVYLAKRLPPPASGIQQPDQVMPDTVSVTPITFYWK